MIALKPVGLDQFDQKTPSSKCKCRFFSVHVLES